MFNRNKNVISSTEQLFDIIYEDEAGNEKKEIVSSPSQMWLIGEFRMKRPLANLIAALPIK